MLIVRILDPDPPRLAIAVNLIIPLKLSGNRQTHAQYSTGDGLNAGRYRDGGKPVDAALNDLAHPYVVDEMTWETGIVQNESITYRISHVYKSVCKLPHFSGPDSTSANVWLLLNQAFTEPL